MLDLYTLLHLFLIWSKLLKNIQIILQQFQWMQMIYASLLWFLFERNHQIHWFFFWLGKLKKIKNFWTEWKCASIYDTLEFDCLTTKSTFWTVDTVLKKDPIINPPGSNTGHLKGSSGVEWPGLHNREHRATQLSTKIRSLLLVYDLVMVNQSSQLYNESTGGQKVAKVSNDHRT